MLEEDQRGTHQRHQLGADRAGTAAAPVDRDGLLAVAEGADERIAGNRSWWQNVSGSASSAVYYPCLRRHRCCRSLIISASYISRTSGWSATLGSSSTRASTARSSPAGSSRSTRARSVGCGRSAGRRSAFRHAGPPWRIGPAARGGIEAPKVLDRHPGRLPAPLAQAQHPRDRPRGSSSRVRTSTAGLRSCKSASRSSGCGAGISFALSGRTTAQMVNNMLADSRST